MLIDTLLVLVLSGAVVAAPICPIRHPIRSYLVKRDDNDSNTSSTVRIVAIVIATLVFIGAFGVLIWRCTKRVERATHNVASSTVQPTAGAQQPTSGGFNFSQNRSYSPILDRPIPNSSIDTLLPAHTIPVGGHSNPWVQNDSSPIEPPPAYCPQDAVNARH